MKSRRAFVALALYAGLRPLGVFGQPALSGALVISGSRTLRPLVVDIAKLFRARHPAVRVEVQGGGTPRAIGDVLSGKSAIGMMGRALRAEERAVRSFAVARDGISAMAHRSNPVAALTRAQMRDIFTRRIVNWRSLGGRDAPIVILARGAEWGSSELIAEYLGIDYAAIRAKLEVVESADIIRAVAADPNAVSYVSIGAAEQDVRTGTPIQLLALDGIAATSATVRSGDFPMSRPLLLVTRDTPRGLARAFVEFALSAAVVPLIIKHDFAPYTD